MSNEIMIFIWLGLILLFGLIEALSPQLTSIWFSAGALVAFLLAVFGVQSIPVQIVAFILVSLAALLVTRPLAKKMIAKRAEPTNADRNIGEDAIVTADIDNVEGTGEVIVKGVVWTAISASGAPISKDSRVTVKKIEGVKLIVEPIEK